MGYKEALDSHLKDKFNIRPWDEGDELNGHRLIVWADFSCAASSGGRARAEAEARDLLARLGGKEEPSTKTAEARNVLRDMAQAVLDFRP